MRVGQYIGVGHTGRREIDVLVQIDSIDDVGVHGTVVNGAWRITLTPTKTICHSPRGEEELQAQILYQAELPQKYHGRYVDSWEVMQYMSARMNSRVPLWWVNAVSRVSIYTSRFVYAVGQAKRAYIAAWTPKQRTNPYDHEDDDIPF